MYWRWLGAIFLSLSLIIGGIIVAELKVPHRIEVFAYTDDEVEIVDKVVQVPPWNSSEGWVGFNVTLLNRWEADYEAYGIILPNDGDQEPHMVMRVVNVTGSSMLKFQGFDEATWNATKVYAAAYLDKNRLTSPFEFLEIDDSPKYVFLFRGLKNETAPRPILINIREAWHEEKALLEPAPINIVIVVVTVSLGLIMTIKSLQRPRTKHLRKQSARATCRHFNELSSD